MACMHKANMAHAESGHGKRIGMESVSMTEMRATWAAINTQNIQANAVIYPRRIVRTPVMPKNELKHTSNPSANITIDDHHEQTLRTPKSTAKHRKIKVCKKS